MERRKFTREFKLVAVRLIRERGVAYTQAARDLSDAIMAKRLPSAHADRQGLRCDRVRGPGIVAGENTTLNELTRL
jgi:transposase